MWFTLLAPLIPTLITQAEKLFGKKAGATKLDVVVKAVQPVVNALATTGKLGSPPPSVMEIAAIVSKIAGELFPSGQSTPEHTDAGTPPPPAVSEIQPPTTKSDIRKWLVWALTD